MSGGSLQLKGVYTRDDAGRITAVTTTGTSKDSWTYGYDTLDRLVSAVNVNDATLNQSFDYAPNGNLTRATRVGTYGYPAAGAARPHAPKFIDGQELTWDPNGNLKTGRNRTFEWDGENRPVSMRLGSRSPVTFFYGPDGGRVKKLAPVPANANCAAAPQPAETLTIGGVQRVTKYACASGAWVPAVEWTHDVHPDARARQDRLGGA